MLLLFPVVFLNLGVSSSRSVQRLLPSQLMPGLLLGCFPFILLVFAHIFSNVWATSSQSVCSSVQVLACVTFCRRWHQLAGLGCWNARPDSNQQPAGAYPGPGQSARAICLGTLQARYR